MNKYTCFSNLYKLEKSLNDDKHNQLKEFMINYFNDNKILYIDDYVNFKFINIWSYFVENLVFFKNKHYKMYKSIIDYSNNDNIINELNKIINEYLNLISSIKFGDNKKDINDKIKILNNNIKLLFKKHKKEYYLKKLFYKFFIFN